MCFYYNLSFPRTLLFSFTLLLIVCTGLSAQTPSSSFEIDSHTAFVVTDPHLDFLSEKGDAFQLFSANAKTDKTVSNIGLILKLAAKNNIPLFIAPHQFVKCEKGWEVENKLGEVMHNCGLKCSNAFSSQDFEGSKADWLPYFKQYIFRNNVTITAPHKSYSTNNSNLVVELRKKGIDKVILCGMAGNTCVDSHLRSLIKQGFEVAIVTDATGLSKLKSFDSPEITQKNFAVLSNKIYSTKEVIELVNKNNSFALTADIK